MKCIEDEIPFELPEGWAWCRLGFIGNWQSGATPNRRHHEYYGGEIPWLKTGDLNDDYINSVPEYITEEGMKNSSVYLNPVGSVLIAMYGATIGKLGIANIALTTNQACCACLPIYIKSRFLFYFLMYQKEYFIKQAVGGAQPNISKEKIVSTLFPVPPINEQEKLVLKLDELFNLVNNIDIDKNSLFEIISTTKSKILDLAIRGKLVHQDPNDEPASVLLERIRAEKEELIKQGKIKRDKKESIIFRDDDNSYYENVGEKMIDISDKLPFNIPDSWCWGKLKDIVIINPRNKLDDDMEAAFIPMPLIEDGYSGNHSFEIRKWKDIKSGFTHFKDGDVGIAKITPCFENRKSVVFKNLYNGYGAGTTELHVLRPYKDTILAEFLLVYAKSQRFIEDGKQTFSGAVGQQRIGKEYIETVYFPIPPLQEQQRIINHINNLFNYLNIIETALS